MKQRRRLRFAYTAEEAGDILAVLDAEPLKWRALVRLLIDTGIRRGECPALKWENIDFKSGEITIAGNLCYTPDKGRLTQTPPRTAISALCSAGDDTIALPASASRRTGEKVMSAFVGTKEGSPEPSAPQKAPRAISKKLSDHCGVARSFTRQHKLAHTFAKAFVLPTARDVVQGNPKRFRP